MMNGNHQEIYREDKELNLRDLVFFLLRHWRSLLVVIVLGAMLGGGVYLTKKALFEKNNAEIQEQQNWVETYQVSAELKTKMDLAWKNRQAYAKQLSYNQNSLIMKMDAENVYTGKLKYYLAAGSSTRLIAENFNSLLSDSNLAEELNEAAGAESEPQYIRELISCDTNADNDSSVNIATSEDGTAPSTKNVVITYTVNYMEKDGCQNMMDVLEDKADALNEQLQKEYGAFTCEKLGNSVVLGVNSSYLSQQKVNMDYLQTYANYFNSLESGFAGQDLEYYQITYLDKSAEAVQPQTFTGNKIKYLIAGIFLLCCCWGAVWVLRYVLDNHVKLAGELKTYYGLPVLGSLRLSAPRKGLDSAVDALARHGGQSYDAADYLAQSLSMLGTKRLMLCTADDGALADALCGSCSLSAVVCYPSRSAEALEKTAKSDGILLEVRKGKTTYNEIERTLEICALQKIRIIGFIWTE